PGRLQRPDPPGRMNWTCASTRAGATSTTSAYSRQGGPTSSASPATWDPRPRPGHHYPAAMHHRRVLPVRGGGRPARSLPAPHVRRPRLDYESHATGLDRNELGALLVAAGLGSPTEHAPRWAGSRQAHRPDTALMTWPGGALGLPRRGELHNPLECPHAQEAARPHRRRLRPPPGWRRVRPARHAR